MYLIIIAVLIILLIVAIYWFVIRKKGCYQWVKFTPSETKSLPVNNIGYDYATDNPNLNLRFPVAAKDASGIWYFGSTPADVSNSNWGILTYMGDNKTPQNLSTNEMYYIKSANSGHIDLQKNVSPSNYMLTPDGTQQVCISDPSTNPPNTHGGFLSRYNPSTKFCTPWPSQAGSVYPVPNICKN